MFQTVSRGAILAVALVFCAIAAEAQTHATLVMDARTGKVIQSENADVRVHPASLTKMMTLYIVFDQVQQGRLSLDQKITVSANAAAQPPSRLGLKKGQKIELRYLIRAAAIKSANDAATAMGDYIGGSEKGFAALMNQYARAMGMNKTTFKNANGLTREGHLSTASDMAALGRRLIYDFPQYYNIFGRVSTSAGIATVRNTNRRVLEGYPGADGIKTGYTRAAGFNVVTSAQRGDRRVLVAVLGGRSSASRNAEAEKLMDVGFKRMPAHARIVSPTPLHTVAVASAGTRSTASTARVAEVSSAPAVSRRPLPRALDQVEISRNSETIAAAIAEVNAEITAAQATRNAPAEAIRNGRPMPRPTAAPAEQQAAAQSPSTFAVAAATPASVSPPRAGEPITTASAGSTSGNDWGVQLGAYRAKGDAERQLLTTALKDVPALAGGLRRVEAGRVQGVTVYRAQFVGLSQQEALGACAMLAQMRADCLPLPPGI